jgi:hypothetical protein
MLYNPQWRRRDGSDLIAWLETKDSEQSYDYQDCLSCLIVQWMGNNDCFSWPEEIRNIYYGRDTQRIAIGDRTSADWTYGKALTRACVAVTQES